MGIRPPFPRLMIDDGEWQEKDDDRESDENNRPVYINGCRWKLEIQEYAQAEE